MEIEKLPSGSYRIRQRYNGQRYSVTVDHKPSNKEALELLAEVMKDVASEALKAIESKLQMKLSNQEVVIPIFGVTHACIIEYVKAQRVGRKLSEFEVTVTDLYTVGCMINDDGEEEIYFDPSISMKLKFKNDALASSDE